MSRVSRERVSATADWFRAFMDAASEVYFRYAFTSQRRLAYVSRAISTLTGYDPERFLADPAFCLSLVAREDRGAIRQIVRARRPLVTSLRLRHKSGAVVRVDIRTVPVVHSRKVVAIEGILTAAAPQLPFDAGDVPAEPTQQRLVALLCEVHDLLHGALGPRDGGKPSPAPSAESMPALALGDVAIDMERMTVTLGGHPVALTARELLVLRYLLRQKGRVVTRRQLLEDVWGYRYTGDDRTVDVHVSRLRRKLPPLRAVLHAVKHVGYRLDSSGASSDVPAASSPGRRIAKI